MKTTVKAGGRDLGECPAGVGSGGGRGVAERAARATVRNIGWLVLGMVLGGLCLLMVSVIPVEVR